MGCCTPEATSTLDLLMALEILDCLPQGGFKGMGDRGYASRPKARD